MEINKETPRSASPAEWLSRAGNQILRKTGNHGAGGRRLGIEQVQQLLIASALSLIVSACNLPADRESRAYNVCLARHPHEAAVCEGPRQAYEVDASDTPARAITSQGRLGY